MKNKIKALVISSIFFTAFSDQTFSQCSDAGVCQLIHTDLNNEKIVDFSLGYKLGFSGKEENVTYHSVYLSSTYYIFEGSSINFRIPYNVQSGRAGHVSGIGDLILSWEQKLLSGSTTILSASAGIKLATGNENKGAGLQMAYQPGLGSNDIIFAVNYSYYDLNFTAGYQLAGARNNNPVRLKRGDDLLLRASFLIEADPFQIHPNILFIKRLSKSTIIDLNAPVEKFIVVDGSSHEQINFIAAVDYEFSRSYYLLAELAVPFLKRDVNVDGLTRSLNMSIGFKYSF